MFTDLILSKWLIYDLNYNFNKKNVDAELLFTNTDSLNYEIKAEDVYQEFLKQKHLLNFGNYPEDSNFFDETNEKAVGKMKDEFIGLKSKMCSIKTN